MSNILQLRQKGVTLKNRAWLETAERWSSWKTRLRPLRLTFTLSAHIQPGLQKELIIGGKKWKSIKVPLQ